MTGWQLYVTTYCLLSVGEFVCHISNPCTHGNQLTLEAPITTAADDFRKYFFIVFQRK